MYSFEFSAAITPVYSVSWFFRNHSNMLILIIINVENIVLPNHFLETWSFFLSQWMKKLLRIFYLK